MSGTITSTVFTGRVYSKHCPKVSEIEAADDACELSEETSSEEVIAREPVVPECVLDEKGHESKENSEYGAKKRFKCELCPKEFTSKCHLAVHRRSHTGERPYKCSYCPRSFKASGDRTVHERLHTGERPYKCEYCPKAFIRSDHLSKHSETHRLEQLLGKKPYKCDLCARVFNEIRFLVVHRRAHTHVPL